MRGALLVQLQRLQHKVDIARKVSIVYTRHGTKSMFNIDGNHGTDAVLFIFALFCCRFPLHNTMC